MNAFEMVAFVAAFVGITIIVVTFLTTRARRPAGPGERVLVEEMQAMKARLATLERLAVERENGLAREIDGLRAPAPAVSAATGAQGVELQ
jgi:hypothetical protein